MLVCRTTTTELLPSGSIKRDRVQYKAGEKKLPVGENSSRVRNVQKKLPQITRGLMRPDHYFVPAGQSTQMVIGASDESDYQIISVSEALYQKFEMKRIFYSRIYQCES